MSFFDFNAYINCRKIRIVVILRENIHIIMHYKRFSVILIALLLWTGINAIERSNGVYQTKILCYDFGYIKDS